MSGWYHGTVRVRLQPGDTVQPGRKVGAWSNWSPHATHTSRRLISGRTVHPGDVVWLSDRITQARDWAEHSLLKATPPEIRRSPAGGIAVYQVRPVDIDYPEVQHGRGREAVCVRAVVLCEAFYEPFDLNACDDCGEPATIGIGSDDQLCASCAADREEEEVKHRR